jgi:hypothetical protein
VATVIFRRVIQDAVEFGSDDERSVSRVYFDLEVDGETHQGLYVNVEEPAYGTHQTDQITVGALAFHGEPVKLDRQAFEAAVKAYYQSLVTSAGYGKHLAKDKGLRTHGDELGRTQVVELDT